MISWGKEGMTKKWGHSSSVMGVIKHASWWRARVKGQQTLLAAQPVPVFPSSRSRILVLSESCYLETCLHPASFLQAGEAR